MKKSRIIQGALGIVLAAGGLYIFYRQSLEGDDSMWASLMREISQVSIGTIILCIACSMLPMWLRSWRLQIMLPNDCGEHKRGFFSTMTISFMANNILPARLGEAARVVLLWRRNKIPIAVGVGSLFVERFLDIAVYLSFLFVPIIFSPTIRSSLQNLGGNVGYIIIYISLISFALTIAATLFYVFAPRTFKNLTKAVIQMMPQKTHERLKKIMTEMNMNLTWLFSPRKVLLVTFLSYVIAFCFLFLLMFLVGDIGSFGVLDSMFAQAFAAFGSAIPLAPGAVGTLHAALQFGLTIVDIAPAKAAAVTVIYHALQYIIVTAAGLILLAGLQIKLSDITEKE